jgi:hypothetical protein
MGLFTKLFGRNQATDLAGGRGWTTDIVGESKFQDNLQTLYRSLGQTGLHPVPKTPSLV